jgi:hypothetical protein
MSSIVNLQYSDLKDYEYAVKIVDAKGTVTDNLKMPAAFDIKGSEKAQIDIIRKSDGVVGSPALLFVGALAYNKRVRRYNIFVSAYTLAGLFGASVRISAVPYQHTVYFKYDVGALDKFDFLYQTENGVAISVPSLTTLYPIKVFAENRSTHHIGASATIEITDDICQVYSITVDSNDNASSSLVTSGGSGVCSAQAQ